jgi:hypothetical protein
MTNVRRFTLEELALHPGTYFNPQTEILIVVDDSPEVDHELFDMDEYEATDWVQITEETPVDEHKRDDLIERFQLAHQTGEDLSGDDPEDDEEDDEDEDDDEVEELELD